MRHHRGHPNSSTELLVSWLQQGDVAADRAAALRSLQELSAGELRALMTGMSVEELLAPLATSSGLYALPVLFRDGDLLPAEPLLEVFSDPTRWHRVPLIIGSNRDEMKLFLAGKDRHVRRRFGVIPTPRDPPRYERLARYHSRQWRAVGVDEPLLRMSLADPQLPLYSYRFDWDDMRANALVDLPRLLGAAHALELDFLFGPLIARKVPGVLHDGNRRGYEDLARAMRDYWAGFAYHGRPGSGRSGSYPLWPAWSELRPQSHVARWAQRRRSEQPALHGARRGCQK